MNAEQKQRLREIIQSSPVYHKITAKAYEGNSKAAGIKAKCLDCCCWQRLEVANCTALACPLWPYRPYQGKGEADELEQEGQVLM